MLVNWKVKKCDSVPSNLQSPDYFVKNEDYWFFKYFSEKPQVDVIDISSNFIIEKIEKKVFHFYLIQGIKAIFSLHKYDLIISHGMQSAVVVAWWQRKFSKKKVKHLVFDIGCFNSAATRGIVFHIMQKISHSIDGFIFHVRNQINYYKQYYPWIVNRCRFIPFGADFDFYSNFKGKINNSTSQYVIVIGKSKSDWLFASNAFCKANVPNLRIVFIGGFDKRIASCKNVEQKGFISIDELMLLISGALFCFMPLEQTPFSFGQMRLLQQMSMGKCILVSRIPSLMDYGIDGKDVIFYSANDYQDCVTKIRLISTSALLRKRIGENASINVKKHFTEKIMAQEVEKFIQDIKGDYKHENKS